MAPDLNVVLLDSTHPVKRRHDMMSMAYNTRLANRSRLSTGMVMSCCDDKVIASGEPGAKALFVRHGTFLLNGKNDPLLQTGKGPSL